MRQRFTASFGGPKTTARQCGQFRLAGKKQLVRGFGKPQVVVMDVTQTLIERQKRRQRQFYWGKNKRHTLKCQLVLELDSGQIICTFFGKGRRHDFKLYQASGVRFALETESLQDKGDQGIQKLHPNSRLPHNKPRGGQLTGAQKADNRALARRRVVPIADQSLKRKSSGFSPNVTATVVAASAYVVI